MNIRYRRLLLPVLLGAGVVAVEAPLDAAAAGRDPAYVTLGDDLTRLKADFNAMAGKLRLMFINGPTCGICLRGMDDLNRAVVASIQDDARAHTLVVHVPTMGAAEEHAVASMPLMPGPRVTHYWDGPGHSGLEFQEALDIPIYAWDVWMIYEPGVRWEEGAAPPAPAFWQHQLGPLPEDTRLDAGEFAAAVQARLAAVAPAGEVPPASAARSAAPGLLAVAQPRGYVNRQNHESRGGYRRLKSISALRHVGRTIIGEQSFALAVETERPRHYRRTLSGAGGARRIVWNGDHLEATGPASAPSPAVPVEFLRAYEFDGWMTDWKAKGHRVRRLGMKKHGDRLPWIMEAALGNGQTWQVYVDSHTGDAYRYALMGEDGEESMAVEFDDFRDAEGFRLPHAVRYFDGNALVAADRYDSIDVVVDDGRRATAR